MREIPQSHYKHWTSRHSQKRFSKYHFISSFHIRIIIEDFLAVDNFFLSRCEGRQQTLIPGSSILVLLSQSLLSNP